MGDNFSIAFCATCKGRLQHLAQTLPKNLADNSNYKNCKFIVLSYNSGPTLEQDDVMMWAWANYQVAIASGQLSFYRYWDGGPFHMAHAKNMSHRLGILEGCDVLCNVDADNYLGKNFANYVNDQFQLDGVFLWAKMVKDGEGRLPRGISGRIVVPTSAFLKAGGYDEQFNTWSPDDKDFNTRLRRLGYIALEIDPYYLNAIRHNDKMRFRDYQHVMHNQVHEDQFTQVAYSGKTIANFGNFGTGTVYKNFSNEPIVLGPLPTRIFGIGMHKTATTSFHAALGILGYESAHWVSAHWAKAIWEEVKATGRSLTVERSYAICDLPIALLFKELDSAYPGSKFILTTRNEEEWLASVEKHWSRELNPFRNAWDNDPFTHKVHKILYGQKGFDREVFLARYRRHNEEVAEYFKNRPNDMLVLDTGEAKWPKLCNFLNRPMPGVPYPRKFRTVAPISEEVKGAEAAPEGEKMPTNGSHPYIKRPKVQERAVPWRVPDLCEAYSWPTGLPGGGVIAIVELGGGWTVADMAQFFQMIGQPIPSITDVSVDGTNNSGNANQDASAEVALDIQVAAASYFVATGKPATIRVYWSQDIGTAVVRATSDGCDVCSISWGADEAEWGIESATAMERNAQTAVEAGMVVFAASGDNDSSDGGPNAANVDCPSSCPHVVGCGGTTKVPTSEVVWNNNPSNADGEGTGGGYSTLFAVQPFQVGAPPPPNPRLGRMVPDVSGNADPDTGYEIVLAGSETVVGGTSAVAPLYAGLFAALGKKLGFVSPALWQNQKDFNDIVSGNNGAYSAAVGPDPCSGIGSPIGTMIAATIGTSTPPPPPPPKGKTHHQRRARRRRQGIIG